MNFETCPLFDELPWIKHKFYNAHTPLGDVKKLYGIHKLNEEFPTVLFLDQKHTDFVTNTSQPVNPADASITTENNLALAIKTADCCPVLLVCTHSKQIAAVHAGWRGALNKITEKTINKLIANGAKVETIIAAIGPNIAQENFPVQDDVRDQFPSDTMEFFVPFEDRWKMDVAGIVRQQIKQIGITQIWQSAINTYTNYDYYSYRRYTNGLSPDFASNISVIVKNLTV